MLLGFIAFFIAIIAVGVAVAVMLWVLKLSRRGELKEKMTDHEAKIMAGAALEKPGKRPIFEKTFGQKKTLAAASFEISLSWTEIGQAIKNGQIKKLWPLFLIIIIFIFVLAIFAIFVF